MKNSDIKSYEQNHINSLTLNLILYATIGTLIATIIAFGMKHANLLGVREIRPELLFIPWGVVLVYAVPLSFHKGVMAERARAEKEGKK